MTFVGVDVGTSFIKGAVLDVDAATLGETRRLPFPGAIAGLPASQHEIDPHEIVSTTQTLIELLLPHAPRCAGVVFCGQMGGLVLATDSGEPRSNYISWQDNRLQLPHPAGGGTFFETMLRRFAPDDWRRLGREVRPGLPVSYLFWLAETRQLPSATVVAANLPDFVGANLCGCPPTTHLTQAVGALDLETLAWHEPLFQRLGLARVQWPNLSDLREPVGELHLGGLRLPWYPPVGDHQCALAGACLGFHELSLNLSTGSQASLLTSGLQLGAYQTRPFFDGLFLNTVTHIPAGRSLNLLVNLLSELAEAQEIELKDPWSYIAREAEAVTGTDLRADLSFFPGPLGAAGTIANIHEGNFRVGHLFRAAFENMAENYDTCARRLSPDQAWRRLVFSGGLALKLELLRRLIAGRFQREFRVCSSTEDALQGLLVLALVIAGRAATAEQAMQILRDR